MIESNEKVDFAYHNFTTLVDKVDHDIADSFTIWEYVGKVFIWIR